LDRLTRALEIIGTVSLGALPPALVTAITSWWNRDTARAQLERERLRRQAEDNEA